MTPKRKQRLAIIFLILLGVSATVALTLTAFEENLLFFFSPTQVANGEAPDNRQIRVGGMVSDGSVKRAEDSLQVKFDVTDYAHTLNVNYEGILPDLFREGQGIVAIGKMNEDGTFQADEVLAKHDENYMPPEVADALEAAKKDVETEPKTTEDKAI